MSVYDGRLYLDTLHAVILVGGILLIALSIAVFWGKKE